jgi:hypothetical protein
MNGGHIQTQGAGRNRGVATAGTYSRNIHNQSLSLQSKSSILLFATTCPTFRTGWRIREECPMGFDFARWLARQGRRVTDDKKIRKGLEATMTRTAALIGERSYRSGRSQCKRC